MIGRLHLILVAGIALAGPTAAADFEIPPPPAHHVDDRAGRLDDATEARLNTELEDFERETSSQIVISLFRRLPEDVTLEEFTVATAQKWGVGRKDRDNGAVLFVFVDDHKLRIEVGYGLEGAIPDATARRILDGIVTPELRRGDFDAAMTRGAEALMAAAKGEFKGDGTLVGGGGERTSPGPPLLMLLVMVLVVVGVLRRLFGGITYDGGRRGTYSGGTFHTFGGGSGGGFGGGGFGGGGGFSGGGGGFGGGGASGGW